MVLPRLTQNLGNMTTELGGFIQEEHAAVGQRHVAPHRYVIPANQPRIRDRLMGVRHRRVVTNAVRSPVRPATQ
jgi:hypothetical protein